jgi:hypothetical protein
MKAQAGLGEGFSSTFLPVQASDLLSLRAVRQGKCRRHQQWIES